MNNKPTLTGVNTMFFIFTGVFLAYQVIAGIILGDALSNHIYEIIAINEILIALFVLAYCYIKKINLKETLRLNRPGLVPSILIILASFPATYAAIMFNTLVLYPLQFVGEIPAQNLPTAGNLPGLLAGIAIVAVLPGICEEIMHRGLLLKAYEKRGSYKAVLFVAIFFGIFHFDITNFLGPVFLGLLIGFYVIRTNSIFAGMLAHFMNNAIALVIRYIAREPSRETITITRAEFAAGIILGTVGLCFVAAIVYAFAKATEGRASIVPPLSGMGQDVKAVFSHWPIAIIIALYVFTAVMFILSIFAVRIFNG